MIQLDRKAVADHWRQMRAIDPKLALIYWRMDRDNRSALQALTDSLRPVTPDLPAVAKLWGLDQAQITASTDDELRRNILERAVP